MTRGQLAVHGYWQAVHEKDSLINAKAATANIDRESPGNSDSLGVWVVSLRQPMGIVTLNGAVSASR